MSTASFVPADLAVWLDTHAELLDSSAGHAREIVPRLAAAGLFGIGVPVTYAGGRGGAATDAVEAIAQVASHSLSAAFVFWGHRTFIEYLLHSPNAGLRETWLPQLLSGEIAGATGLSNAMKYLSALEPLQMKAEPVAADGSGARRWALSGSLPWITNLRPEGFLVAAAFDHADSGKPSIFAVPHDLPGVGRSADLDLIALRASNTAALKIEGAQLDERWMIADNASTFLTRVRPGFLGLQCGLSLGLARRALASVALARPASRLALAADAEQLADELARLTDQLCMGIAAQTYVEDASNLFRLRIALASLVASAVNLEVQASGGQGYLREQSAVARRVREASFVPIVTPSIVQLKHQLALHARTE
ncbi:acyl-CoA dehydrogenase [Paraburkholderia sp. CNPSo 3155]|uniref:Alkylation response protein AidB-like acyl-CoA dehydrogenase n=1 Tax=Paraburkholderia atlantica TaxID=2654982 RepID=A0A6I1PPZ1_PARAM|nr:acyl-CoA dehydrogenase family protein [Paraburkholderia atlantica]MBB5425950.1 alkylation response protein AidB-like acyl-CoA dehydrogenase [Paraburkholderia atlantica]MPW06736.1 acyl-CoA dehydrogenase [Paraburkholderia atlantica]NUY32315.1 acyl-CoA dehydrogenase [Paraburkholderia atlantica]